LGGCSLSCRRLRISGDTNRRVVEQLTQLSQQSGYTRLLSFLNILGALTQTPDEVQALPQNSHSARFDHTDAARMDKVFRHLNAHSREPISLETIAQLASMTPPALTAVKNSPASPTASTNN
jgi:hypothetical protein|tara:strand:+ start:2459 stop:2824 length:366 start_codon:yes stop_codon:yes gene_type:complete